MELVATIEWHEAPYGAIGRHYYFMELAQSLGFFGRFRCLIGEYVFRGEVGRRPVRKIVLARNMELMPRAREEYDLRVELLAPEFSTPGFLWKLRLAARIPFARDHVTVTYIKPISE